MKPKSPARLTALLLAALFALPQLAPSSFSAQAQRRRRRAPARQSSTRPHARPPAPAARAETRPAPAATPSAPRAARETSFESLLAADAYGVIIEVRKVGQLSQNAELKTALAALRLSGEMPKEVADLVSFVNRHAEALGEARYVLTMMPGSQGVPWSMSALEFPTVEAAAAFEPKYRALIDEGVKAYKDALPKPQPGSRDGRGTPPQPQQMFDFDFDFNVRRVGNIIILGSQRYTLKRLRGGDAGLLSDSVNYQTMRGRFTSESVFVYVDTGAVTRGFKAQMELIQKQAEEAQAAQAAAQPEGDLVISETTDLLKPGVTVVEPVGEGTPTAGATEDPAEELRATPPEAEGRAEGALGPASTLTPEEEAAMSAEEKATIQPVKPSEEQVAAAQLSSLLRGWEMGSPRIPETFAVAFALEGGTVIARAAVANTPDGAVNLIPFLPNVFNGPPVSSESATIAPADTDVFFSTSLEWSRIFGGLLKTASERAAQEQAMAADHPVSVEGNHAAVSPAPGVGNAMLGGEAVVETVEKLFGFKFKEDLLPSLGNEIAFSIPLSWFTKPGRRARAEEDEEKEGKEKDEKKAEAGFVILVALTDQDKVRKILPRVAMALGAASPGAAAQTEKREGFDIQTLGGFSYVIINNHLALAEDVRAVRHVVDSYARRQTLDATNKFRDATGWQPKQRVAQVFVSDTLMKYAQEDARKMSKVSSDPLVLALASQLDLTPEPAAYAATNEGDVLVHEMRVPVNFIKTYATNLMISIKEAPITNNESMARYALTTIVNAQERFKVERQQQRYATLEELLKEELIEKWVFEGQEYKIEVSAAGDKFEATAVPLNYGKTGRRSFFVNESGVTRAADHQGKPATVEDPPVNEEH